MGARYQTRSPARCGLLRHARGGALLRQARHRRDHGRREPARARALLSARRREARPPAALGAAGARRLARRVGRAEPGHAALPAERSPLVALRRCIASASRRRSSCTRRARRRSSRSSTRSASTRRASTRTSASRSPRRTRSATPGPTIRSPRSFAIRCCSSRARRSSSRAASRASSCPDAATLASELARFRSLVAFNRVLTDRHPDIAEPMVQEYLTAAETSIFSVSGFVAEDGTIVARAAMKVLQRPRKVGIGLCFEGRELEPVLVEKLASALQEDRLPRHVRVGVHRGRRPPPPHRLQPALLQPDGLRRRARRRRSR